MVPIDKVGIGRDFFLGGLDCSFESASPVGGEASSLDRLIQRLDVAIEFWGFAGGVEVLKSCSS